MSRNYNPATHDLAYVIEDLDERAHRLEQALKALASEPGQPHHAAEIALKILNQES